MESTAQYWGSVWLELEPCMRLHLAQAFSNRAPRERKHDFKDAERLVRRLIAIANVVAQLTDGTGSASATAFLHFDLQNPAGAGRKTIAGATGPHRPDHGKTSPLMAQTAVPNLCPTR
jgi:hypothetical protein